MAVFHGPNVSTEYKDAVLRALQDGGAISKIPASCFKKDLEAALALNPSLVTIPFANKEEKLYSILPNSGLGDFTVQRNTTASRVNEAGLIEFVGVNEPRFDWGEGGSCPKLLVEPERMNLLLRSEEFDDAYWTKGNVTVTPNNTTAPDGASTADKIVEDAIDSAHLVSRDFGLNDDTFSISFFAKKAERSFIRVLFQNSPDGIVDIDLNNGVILNQGNLISNAKITAYPDDWYRIEVTTTVGLSPFQATLRINTGIDANTFSYLGDGTSGLFIWGAQLEEGSYPTSYIKTVANQVTRNADVISKTGIASLIGQSEGALFVEAKGFPFENSLFFCLHENTLNNNRLFIIFRTLLNQVQFVSVVDGVAEVDQTFSFTNLANNYVKVAYRYAPNDSAFFINGVKLGEDLICDTYTASTLSRLSFANANGSGPFFGNVKQLAIYKTAFTDQEAIALTTL